MAYHPPTQESITRDIAIIKAMSRGALRKDVAAEHNISPNTVTYILRRDAPWLVRKHRRDEQARQEKLYYQFARAAEKAKPCIICGTWVFRQSTYRTCSADCAAIYKVLRKRIDPSQRQKNLESLARSLLRRSDGPKHRIIWANKILAGEITEPVNGLYYHVGSRPRQVARLIGLLTSEPLPRPYP